MTSSTTNYFEVSEISYRDFPFTIEPPIKLATQVNHVAQVVIVQFLREQYGLEDTENVEHIVEDQLDQVGYNKSIKDSREISKLKNLEHLMTNWLPGHEVVAKYVH